MSGKRRLVLALATAGSLAGCAGGDGVPVSPGHFDGNSTLETLSGVGLIERKQEKIDYSPRGGIALPKNYQLPQPDSTVVASKSAAWPKDPDARRKRKEAEFEALSLQEHRRRTGHSHNTRDVFMTPEEAEQGRKDGVGQNAGPTVTKREDDVFMLPSEYNKKKTKEDVENETAAANTPEPTRKYLTEPPTGYRAPTAAKTAEGQKAAEEAMKARRENPRPGAGGLGGIFGL